MIAPPVVEEIKRLLHAGSLTQRQIAQKVGVSRGTVQNIDRGKRRVYKPRPQEVEFSGLPTRCPGCGGMVLMPCLLCRIQGV